MTDEKLNEINEETVEDEKPSAAIQEKTEETAEEAVLAETDEIKEAVEEVKENTEPVIQETAEAVEETVNRVNEVTEEVRETAEPQLGWISAETKPVETVIPKEEKTAAEKPEEKQATAETVKPEVKTEPVQPEIRKPTITVNTPKEERDLQKELERMRRDYRRRQQQVNDLVVQVNRKKSLSNFLLALLAFLTIGLSVGGSYLVTTLNNKKPTETVVVYEGVETGQSVNVSSDDLTSIVAGIENTVVEVYTESVSYSAFYGEYVTGGAGSGVIYSSDGYIITNNHVIENARSINVKLHDGTEYNATLVATDEETDLAVIKIDATGLQPAVLGDSEKLKVGESVIAIGNPLGTLGGTVTTGIISALSREITIEGQKMTLLQTNTAISPGNSGGGLFNTSGELIAIVNAKSSGDNVEGIGFAIPTKIVRTVVRDLITHGYVTGRPSIGIKCVSIETQRYMMYYKVNDYGVYVSEVINEDAIAAGLQAEDLIVAIEDSKVASYEDMKSALNKFKPGDVVTLTVLRGRERVNLNITLIEKNAVNN